MRALWDLYKDAVAFAYNLKDAKKINIAAWLTLLYLAACIIVLILVL